MKDLFWPDSNPWWNCVAITQNLSEILPFYCVRTRMRAHHSSLSAPCCIWKSCQIPLFWIPRWLVSTCVTPLSPIDLTDVHRAKSDDRFPCQLSGRQGRGLRRPEEQRWQELAGLGTTETFSRLSPICLSRWHEGGIQTKPASLILFHLVQNDEMIKREKNFKNWKFLQMPLMSPFCKYP